MQAQMDPVKESDSEKIARLEDEIVDLSRQLDRKSEELQQTSARLEASEDGNERLQRKIEQLEESYDAFRVAASVHDFLRDQRIIKDPILDVPLKVAAQPWVGDLVRAVSDGMP